MTRQSFLYRWRDSLSDFSDRHPLLAFSLFAFALIWFAQFGTAKLVYLTGHIRDTDDAMRLAQIRDWLAGQSWFDLHQYRVDPPGGLLMHWSRLIDAPVAALILFFKFFTGTDMAERLARLLWPALMQLAIFASILAITLKLAGRQALFAASILLGFNMIISMQMEPGRIDHHDVLMLLSTLTALSTFAALRRPQFALLAGLCAGTAMAIGFEPLPVIAVIFLFYCLLWLTAQPHADSLLRNFGFSFAVSSLAFYFATTSPALYHSLACDSQSYATAVFAAGIGLSCLLLARFGANFHTRAQKLAAGFACAAALLAVLYYYASPCLSGPFAGLPEDLREKWLAQVFEAAGLGKHLQEDFLNNLAFAGPLAVSLVCALTAFYFLKQDRWRWGLLTALVTAHVILSFVHLRMVTYAILFALPAGAWCVTALRNRSQSGMALLYIILVPSAWAFAVQTLAKPLPEISHCGDPASYEDIGKLPKARVLAPIDLGPFLLAHTKHSLYGAPYHRNVDGMRFVFATLYEPPASALPKIRERKIDYVVLCDKLGEQRAIDLHNSDSLAARLMKGEAVPGFTKMDVKAPMHVWRVR